MAGRHRCANWRAFPLPQACVQEPAGGAEALAKVQELYARCQDGDDEEALRELQALVASRHSAAACMALAKVSAGGLLCAFPQAALPPLPAYLLWVAGVLACRRCCKGLRRHDIIAPPWLMTPNGRASETLRSLCHCRRTCSMRWPAARRCTAAASRSWPPWRQTWLLPRRLRHWEWRTTARRAAWCAAMWPPPQGPLRWPLRPPRAQHCACRPAGLLGGRCCAVISHHAEGDV